DAGPVVYYVGFDPTADSLHAGHLLPVMCMSWLQRFGHKPIVVLGGGTGRVGDPTGKDKTREVLTPEVIAHNLRCQKEQISRYLSFEGDNAAIMVDNAEWLMQWGYVDFLRDIGRHFSVNRMLTAEGVRQRLDRNQGLSFIEFNYHLLQSYDFLHLHQEHGCTVQLGGDDQWFHFLGGIELIRRVAGNQGHAFTIPLLLTASGKKMGKTESGAVFLDRDRCSPYDWFQYWLNVDDADVERFLRLYTWLPLGDIEAATAEGGRALRDAKRLLARATTAMAHSEADMEDADFVSATLFSKAPLSDPDKARIVRVLSESGTFPKTTVAPGSSWAEAAVAAGLVASRSEAGRMVKQGGARIWQDRVVDAGTAVDHAS
ncbi:MAG: tyrosine--tRNA ligase, partial [Myxococcota bacterium]|nr:tyrosine--tRNA ligase [Myxococcota bacterium]